MLTYRRRKLLSSSVKRAFRWEFWPMGLFYIPVVFYILYLIIRYRGLSFTAVNPGMPGSGFVGESKSLSLLQLQQHSPEKTAQTAVILHKDTIEQKIAHCQHFMQERGLNYPVVLKPDFGQRGVGVEIIPSDTALTTYLQKTLFDTVIQEHIVGVEFGVFYVREPDKRHGSIFSLTHKCFPSIVGDGVSTIEMLICEHPRLHYMAAFLLNLHRNILHSVPDQGEVVDVVKLGSHCRGSLFLEGQAYLTSALSETIDHLSQQMEGFYFGRYDVRAKDIAALQRGEIKVIEVNGVTSESTNIYDPKNSLLTAYKILFKQWSIAFKIGKQNMHHGYKTMGVFDLIAKVKGMNKGA
jgi:hypothetical protein